MPDATTPRKKKGPSEAASIAAYEQTCEQWRSSNALGWGAGGLLIAATFGGLATAATTDEPNLIAGVMAVASLVPMYWWVRMMERLKTISELQMEEIVALERRLRLSAFTTVHAGSRAAPGRFSTQWQRALCAAYVVAAIIVVGRIVDSATTADRPVCDCTDSGTSDAAE